MTWWQQLFGFIWPTKPDPIIMPPVQVEPIAAAPTIIVDTSLEEGLKRLGYYGSKDEMIGQFKSDYRTLAPLDGLMEKLKKAPAQVGACRRWRLTQYCIADEHGYDRAPSVTVYDQTKKKIGTVGPGFFSFLSLQGSGRLVDGRLINVTGTFVPVSGSEYAPVWEYHKKYLSKRPAGYSGLQMSDGNVVKAMSFHVVPPAEAGKGYGKIHGVALDPYRTLAADIGRTTRAEPLYKGKEGVVPLNTRVFILEFLGTRLPDGTVHDGWFTVNDTGGGIFGTHFDVFSGSASNTRQMITTLAAPGRGHIWFQGVEEKLLPSYSYGLRDA